MWIDKLLDGVLEVETPIGRRFVQPNLAERAYLIWTFRNFFSLPQQVLRPWERRLVDRLWAENRFVSVRSNGTPEAPVIGRVERRAHLQAEVVQIHNESIRKPAVSSTSPATEQGHEAASA